jgi:hypothetical protein
MRGGNSLNGLADLDLEGDASNYQAVIDALRTKLGRRSVIVSLRRSLSASPRYLRETPMPSPGARQAILDTFEHDVRHGGVQSRVELGTQRKSPAGGRGAEVRD